jgi:hypothetical protein
MQSISSTPELKPLVNMEDTVISFHGEGYMDTQSGLELQLWADPDSPPFKINLSIDILGSIAMLTTYYRTALISVCYGVLIIALGEIDWNLVDAGFYHITKADWALYQAAFRSL